MFVGDLLGLLDKSLDILLQRFGALLSKFLPSLIDVLLGARSGIQGCRRLGIAQLLLALLHLLASVFDLLARLLQRVSGLGIVHALEQFVSVLDQFLLILSQSIQLLLQLFLLLLIRGSLQSQIQFPNLFVDILLSTRQLIEPIDHLSHLPLRLGFLGDRLRLFFVAAGVLFEFQLLDLLLAIPLTGRLGLLA